MNTNRTTIFLHDGRAWVAELKDGQARVSSLVAWLTAHPGRGALRSLALEALPSAPRARVPSSGPTRGRLASLLRLTSLLRTPASNPSATMSMRRSEIVTD